MDLSEKLAVKRHDELRGDLKALVKAISELDKDDPELKLLLRENSQAINNFVKAVQKFEGADKKEVTVQNDTTEITKVFSAFSIQVAEILKGIDSRLKALENKPMPKKLEAKRHKYTGEIEYITIEYNK